MRANLFVYVKLLWTISTRGRTVYVAMRSTYCYWTLFLMLLYVTEQVLERNAALDMELIKCGDHHKALSSFTDWLTDAETRQANQRPFSVDYKAIKPQLQTQQVSWFVPNYFLSGIRGCD